LIIYIGGRNRVLPLPQGNHVAKFGKNPIYRTKVIVWKPVWTPKLAENQTGNFTSCNARCIRTNVL
jgi:hypothetical protein